MSVYVVVYVEYTCNPTKKMYDTFQRIAEYRKCISDISVCDRYQRDMQCQCMWWYVCNTCAIQRKNCVANVSPISLYRWVSQNISQVSVYYTCITHIQPPIDQVRNDRPPVCPYVYACVGVGLPYIKQVRDEQLPVVYVCAQASVCWGGVHLVTNQFVTSNGRHCFPSSVVPYFFC